MGTPDLAVTDDRRKDAGRVEVGGVEMVLGTPAAALRALIGPYHGYRERGGAPGRHRGLPSPYLTVIVTLDDPLEIAAHPDPAQPPGRYESLIGGLHTTPALITHEGRQAGVQIALSPLGARALLGLPAGSLGNTDVEASAVLGRTAGELHDRLNSAPDWERRFAILDELLMRRAGALLRRPGRERGVPSEVARAWRLLLSTGGTAPVAGLAREVGWSPRHLRARFTAETGLSPKAAARVIRFDRTRRRLQRLAAQNAAPPATSAADRDAGAARRDAGAARRDGGAARRDGGAARRDGGAARRGAGAAGEGMSAAGRGAGAVGLADLAVECGYYDQAHLAREFRDLAGCPPSRWLAEELRNVQDPAAPPPSDSAA
ncbi:AraC family transcriptional regulator [Sphaerisporangium dianthi]|uniref:Helix-turn-helix domain-containing protein n=1 Tax=Sphaerisporangium dianthi TaxID=1436120 RepID=A0ABV9C893_9ACTN